MVLLIKQNQKFSHKHNEWIGKILKIKLKKKQLRHMPKLLFSDLFGKTGH